jgi:hypothetical protein
LYDDTRRYNWNEQTVRAILIGILENYDMLNMTDLEGLLKEVIHYQQK